MQKIIVFSLLVISAHSFELHNPWNPVEIANVQPRIDFKRMNSSLTNLNLWNTLSSSDFVSRLTRAIPATNDTCSRDIVTALDALAKKNVAAMQLFDSWAKLPSGIVEGNIQWFGSFDQCRNVSFVEDDVQFRGQYCSAKLDLKSHSLNLWPIDAFFYGFCVPDSCSEQNITTLLTTALSIVAKSLEIVNLKCNTAPSLVKADIAFISLSAVITCFIITGTVLELIYRWKASRETAEGDASTESGALLNGWHASSLQSIHVPTTKSRMARFFICFSLRSNGAKLLSTSPSSFSAAAASSKTQVACLHGIRVITMNWIVLCNMFAFVSTFLDNPVVGLDIMKRFSFQVIINGFVSVDSFFVLSGFLVGYLTFLELESKGGKLNWALYYVHRIIRIVPLYGFVIFTFVTMAKFGGDGPLFPYYIRSNFTRNCEKYWWTNLLFINNFYPKLNYACLQWTWYLAAEMQFFLLSPLLIYPLFRSRKTGILIAFLTILACTITYGVLNTYYGLSPRLFDSPKRKIPDDTSPMELTYTKPYARIQPYVVGILAGYVLFARRSLHIPKVVAFVGWITAALLGLLVVYGLYPLYHDTTVQWDQSVYSLYNCTFRLVWGLVIAWILIACHRRRGGPVNAILSWKVWIPLGRLTYGVYLIHIIILCVIFVNLRQLIHYTDLTMAFLYVAILVLSYVGAFLFALFIEYPLFALEELLRKG